MKIAIRELIKKPAANKKILKRALRIEVIALYYMGKFPPRYYAYKMMLKYINEMPNFGNIFSDEILNHEVEIE